MKRRLVLPLVVGVVAALVTPWGQAAYAQETQLVYSLPQARAYAAKISVHGQVIENAPKCRYDPEHPENDTKAGNGTPPADEDHPDYKYKCDSNQYVQTPNCPTAVAIGPTASPPIIGAPQGPVSSGKAGATPVTGSDVPQSNPVRSNDIIVDGHVGHLGDVVEAAGLASKRFVDLSGRQAGGEAHTESDAFSAGKHTYEERCWPVDSQQRFAGNSSSYVHLLSRSGSIQTFHFAECVGDTCRFVDDASPPAANKATTMTTLTETGGRIFGTLNAVIDGFTFQQGAFTAEAIATYMEFSSDGTKDGLNWKVVSHVSGAKIAGVPTNLPAGASPIPVCPPSVPNAPSVPGACFAVGMAAPYVKSTADGKQLTMIAPGLVIATDQQTAYYAGGELLASFGRETPASFGSGSIVGFETIGGGGFSFIPGTGSADPFLEAPALPTGETEAERTIAIRQIDASQWPAGSILAIGAAAFLVLLAGWMQRFAWAKRVYEVQPFRFLFWMYRAFIRT